MKPYTLLTKLTVTENTWTIDNWVLNKYDMKNNILETPSQYPKHTAIAVPISVPSLLK